MRKFLTPSRGRRSSPSGGAYEAFPRGKSRSRSVRFTRSLIYIANRYYRVPKVTAHYCDVSDSESVKSVVAEIVKDHGKIDHLVTSAGFTENFDAIEYPPERLQKLWGVDVNGTYFFACEVARHLMERKVKGSMVMIGSMSGAIVNVPQPQAPYNAAKAAVRHLAASFAVEWAHAGIRVNVISPGYMLTAL